MNMFIFIAAGATKLSDSMSLTVVLSVVSVSIAAMVAFIKIFSKKLNPNDKPGVGNQYCSQKLKDLDRIEKNVQNNLVTNQELKDIIYEFKITLAELQKDVAASSKTIEEMKQDNRELAKRLEFLLSQLVSYIND